MSAQPRSCIAGIAGIAYVAMAHLALASLAPTLSGCRHKGSGQELSDAPARPGDGPLPSPSGSGPHPGAPPSPSGDHLRAFPSQAGGLLDPSAARVPLAGCDGMPVSFAPLARRADPAVATVKSRVEHETASGRRRVVSESMGTAFVYDADGLLLTNNHVIEDASEVLVSFFDGRELSAKVVGRDKHTDVAVLRIDERGLPSLPLGDSDAIEVGDWVVAIGNPFGLSHTVSAGILSAKGRTREDVKGLDPSGYFNFLQTDASINPGNSGGPLLNMRGEVVGINAAVRANANSIGFAIPVNMVKQLLPMLLRDGKIRRSAIGMSVDPLNAIEAGRLKRPDRKGAWVKSVLPGGPAERAGIAPDDVVLAFDGKPVEGPNELRWMASIAGVSAVASVRIARGERVFEVKVTLGELTPSLGDDAEDR